MHLLGVLRVGPSLGAHARDRGGIERSDVIGALRVERSATQHRLGAAFLERGIVEERVRRRVQDGARERARGRHVDGARQRSRARQWCASVVRWKLLQASVPVEICQF